MAGKVLSPKFANLVYTVLVLYAGVLESHRDMFLTAHIDAEFACPEYRFGGYFGFGGKYWSGRNAISYYSEDRTKKLDKLVVKINKLLGELRD